MSKDREGELQPELSLTLPPGAPFLLLVRRISKQGTPKSVTKAHNSLAATSLKFRAWIAKF